MTRPLGRLASRCTNRLLAGPVGRGLSTVAARVSRLLAAGRPARPSAGSGGVPVGARRASAWGTAGLLAAFGAAPLGLLGGTAAAQGPAEPYGPPGGFQVPAGSGAGFGAGFDPAATRYIGPAGTRPVPGAAESPFVVRGRTGLNGGDGLGYQDGYQSFTAFVPYLWGGDSLLFVDLSGFASYETNGGGGANLGVGARRYFAGIDRVLGANAYFDIDGGQPDDTTFTRFGFGAESLGRYVSLRANAYVPLENSEDTFDGFTGAAPAFVGNNISLAAATVTRLQYGGVDAEVGGPLPFIGQYGFSAFTGGYILDAEGVDPTVGYQFRLDSHVNNDLNVGMRLTSDPDFDTNVWVTASLSTPRGSIYDLFRNGWFRQETVFEKLDSRVIRHERAFTRVVRDDRDVLLNDPDDGNPVVVVHVDPQAAGGGNGTIENPFNDFDQFANDPSNDILRVVASPVADAELLTDGPIVLFDDQRLLSSAVPHFVFAQQGTFALPGFTPGAALPRLINAQTAASSVVLLSEVTTQPEPPEGIHEVSGFLIDGIGGLDPLTGAVAVHDGITSQGGISGFDINRNVFEGVRSGTVLTHVGTTDGTQRIPAFDGVFVDNTLTGIGPGSATGFGVTAINGSTLRLLVDGNSATAFAGEDDNGNGLLDAGEDFNGDGLLTPGTGFRIAAESGAAVDALVIGNAATANGSALTVSATGGGTVGVTSAGNAFTGNLSPLGGTRLLADGNGTVNATFTGDSLGENAGPQVVGRVTNNGALNLAIDESTLDRVTIGNTGLLVTTDTAAGNIVNASVTGSSFVGRAQAAGTAAAAGPGPGVNFEVNGGSLDLTVGGVDPGDGNNFEQNAGAGVAVLLAGTSVGTVDVLGNNIVTTQDDEAGLAFDVTRFDGDGINLETRGRATLFDSQVDMNVIGSAVNPALGNAGDGIEVLAGDVSTIQNLLIGNLTDPPLADGNIVANNAGDGIFVRRTGDATVDGVVIQDNIVTGNDNGVVLQAQGSAAPPTTVSVVGNSITGNAQDGIALQHESDAQLATLIDNNVISANGADGIHVFAIAANGDTGFVSGRWVRNTITNNALSGIISTGNTSNLMIGEDVDGTAVAFARDNAAAVQTFAGITSADDLGNLIDSNGLNIPIVAGRGSAAGVVLAGTGTNLVFQGNTITRNNQTGAVNANGQAGDGGGVDISGSYLDGNIFDFINPAGPTGSEGVIFDLNRITENNGDGVELLTTTVNSIDIGLSRNDISRNTNRGVDALNRAGFLNVEMDTNRIFQNGGIATYFVGTNSTTQDQFEAAEQPDGSSVAAGGNASHGLQADGAFNQTYFTRLVHNRNVTVGNGLTAVAGPDGGFASYGLVMRVGTTDGGYDFDEEGGFATNGGGLFNNGGMYAVVQDNTLAGNAGTDVFVESFTSTVAPPTTAGTFSATEFTVNNYQGDPLARLDLVFFGNAFDVTDFNNLGAFYNNAEGTFKSRLNSADPPGPFTSATRRRNAQRLAYRDETLQQIQLDPANENLENDGGALDLGPQGGPGASGLLLYAGIGRSTFRVDTDDQFQFLIDDTVVSPTANLFNDPGDANGVFLPGSILGEQPYGWSLYDDVNFP